jgi:GT2 family glycosyltransferase
VDYVFGAAMLIRRSLLEQVGLFDEQFFLYMEDMDLCVRTQATGYEIRFVPEAVVWHQGSASTYNNPVFRRYHQSRSSLLFLRKHASLLSVIPSFVFWSLVLLRDILLNLIRGEIASVLGSCIGLLRGISDVIGKTKPSDIIPPASVDVLDEEHPLQAYVQSYHSSVVSYSVERHCDVGT